MATDNAAFLGEVIALDASGARVRLKDGRQGTVPNPGEGLRIGSRETFLIQDGSGREGLTLAVARSAVREAEPIAPATPHSFDREFDRLQDALANHGPHSIRPRGQDDALGEKRIETWMHRVEKTVTELRKRRAKRLSEQA